MVEKLLVYMREIGTAWKISPGKVRIERGVPAIIRGEPPFPSLSPHYSTQYLVAAINSVLIANAEAKPAPSNLWLVQG